MIPKGAKEVFKLHSESAHELNLWTWEHHAHRRAGGHGEAGGLVTARRLFSVPVIPRFALWNYGHREENCPVLRANRKHPPKSRQAKSAGNVTGYNLLRCEPMVPHDFKRFHMILSDSVSWCCGVGLFKGQWEWDAPPFARFYTGRLMWSVPVISLSCFCISL